MTCVQIKLRTASLFKFGLHTPQFCLIVVMFQRIEEADESLTSIGTRRLRMAGGLGEPRGQGTRRLSSVSEGRSLSTDFSADKRQSRAPSMGAGRGSIPPSVEKRASVAPVPRPGRQSIRQSMAPRQPVATPDNRRPSEIPTRRETMSFMRASAGGTVRRSTMLVDPNGLAANQTQLMNYTVMETIEDFSARILQEQQIRFNSKRQILKLMLDEADIDADLLMTQDLDYNLRRVDEEEALREDLYERRYPPPPPSPHPKHSVSLITEQPVYVPPAPAPAPVEEDIEAHVQMPSWGTSGPSEKPGTLGEQIGHILEKDWESAEEAIGEADRKHPAEPLPEDHIVNPLAGVVKHLHEVDHVTPNAAAQVPGHAVKGSKEAPEPTDPTVARVMANRKHREEQLEHISQALDAVENYKHSHPHTHLHSHAQAPTPAPAAAPAPVHHAPAPVHRAPSPTTDSSHEAAVTAGARAGASEGNDAIALIKAERERRHSQLAHISDQIHAADAGPGAGLHNPFEHHSTHPQTREHASGGHDSFHHMPASPVASPRQHEDHDSVNM